MALVDPKSKCDLMQIPAQVFQLKLYSSEAKECIALRERKNQLIGILKKLCRKRMERDMSANVDLIYGDTQRKQGKKAAQIFITETLAVKDYRKYLEEKEHRIRTMLENLDAKSADIADYSVIKAKDDEGKLVDITSEEIAQRKERTEKYKVESRIYEEDIIDVHMNWLEEIAEEEAQKKKNQAYINMMNAHFDQLEKIEKRIELLQELMSAREEEFDDDVMNPEPDDRNLDLEHLEREEYEKKVAERALEQERAKHERRMKERKERDEAGNAKTIAVIRAKDKARKAKETKERAKKEKKGLHLSPT